MQGYILPPFCVSCLFSGSFSTFRKRLFSRGKPEAPYPLFSCERAPWPRSTIRFAPLFPLRGLGNTPVPFGALFFSSPSTRRWCVPPRSLFPPIFASLLPQSYSGADAPPQLRPLVDEDEQDGGRDPKGIEMRRRPIKIRNEGNQTKYKGKFKARERVQTGDCKPPPPPLLGIGPMRRRELLHPR